MAYLHTSHGTGALSEQVVTTVDIVGSTVDFRHLILIKSHIPTDVVVEVLTYLVAPVQSEFNTRVLHRTGIAPLVGETCRSRNLHIEQEVLSLLAIPVESQAKTTTEETSVETEVNLL